LIAWRKADRGVAVNLLALRHEIWTVLVIEDPRWYERESGNLRICEEFLQQCEQAELLPDQRWVQLISLTRPRPRGGAGVVGPPAGEHHRGPGRGRRRAWPPGRSRGRLLTPG
jgi:hypothetical protein